MQHSCYLFDVMTHPIVLELSVTYYSHMRFAVETIRVSVFLTTTIHSNWCRIVDECEEAPAGIRCNRVHLAGYPGI